MPALAFLLLLALSLRLLWRLVAGCAELGRVERIAAALTFGAAAWNLVLTTLCLTGAFDTRSVLVAGTALDLSLWLAVRRHARPPLEVTPFRLRELGLVGLLLVPWAVHAVFFFVWLGANLPITDFDGLMYHVPMAVHMVHDHGVRDYPGESFYVNNFPRGGELWQAVTLLLTRSLALVDLVQWPFLALTAIATCGLGRRLGLSRRASLIAVTLPILAPMNLYQCISAYVDVQVACWVVVSICAIAGSPSLGPVRRAWLGAAAGLALTTKFNAAPMFAVLGCWALAHWGWRALFAHHQGQRRHVLAAAMLFLALFLPWFVRNALVYGSPLFPFRISLGSTVIFPGPYSTKDIGEAKPWFDMTFEYKWYHAWTGVDVESWARMDPFAEATAALDLPQLFDPNWGHKPDERLGGLGMTWPALLLPALAAAWVLARMGRTCRPWTGLLLVLVALFAFSPSSWKPRFSLYLLWIGALAWALLYDSLATRRIGRAALVLVTLTCVLFDWTTVVRLNREAEKLARWETTHHRPTASTAEWFLWPAPNIAAHQVYSYVVRRAREGDVVSFSAPKINLLPGFLFDEYGTWNVYPMPEIGDLRQWIQTIADERITWMVLGPGGKKQSAWMHRVPGARLVFERPEYQVWSIPRRETAM